MILLSRAILTLSLVTFIAGCSGDSSPASKRQATATTSRAAKPKERKSPFKLIESARQNVGPWRNTLDLYALEGPFDIEAFKKLCRQKKEDPKLKDLLVGFHYIVVFDKVENAKPPTNPFTARYNGDVDEDKAKHIIAMYEYNSANESNGYDIWYPGNMWESKSVETKSL